jgi:hypothetical protein
MTAFASQRVLQQVTGYFYFINAISFFSNLGRSKREGISALSSTWLD